MESERLRVVLDALRDASASTPSACLGALQTGLAAIAPRTRLEVHPEASAAPGLLEFGTVHLPACGCLEPGALARAPAPCDPTPRPWRVGAHLGAAPVAPAERRLLAAFGTHALEVLRAQSLRHQLAARAGGEGEALVVLDGATAELRFASAGACAQVARHPSLALLLVALACLRAPRVATLRFSEETLHLRARSVRDGDARWVAITLETGARPRPGATAAPRLTPREREVAERVALGETNREVAQALGTSPATVKHQVARIYAKTGVQGRAELANLLLAGALPPWAPTPASEAGADARA